MREMINRTKQHAELAMNFMLVGRKGIIVNFDPKSWKISVRFYPVGDTKFSPGTADISLGSPCVGNGWGAYFWPSLGAQVMVLYEQGNNKNPVGITQTFDQQNFLPIQDIKETEMWLVHKSGSKLVFKQDGSIEISSDTMITLKAPETNISVNGDNLKKLINGNFKELFNEHTHTVPSVGESNAPTQQMNDSNLSASLSTD